MDQSGSRLAEQTSPAATETPEFLFQLLNAVHHSIIVVDREERIVFWNEHATQLYGYTRAEAMGRPIGEVTVRDQDGGGARCILDAVWAGTSWAGEFPVSHRDGRSVPARVRLFPMYDSRRQVTGIIGVSEDISKEVAAREALAETQERFELLARRPAHHHRPAPRRAAGARAAGSQAALAQVAAQ